MKWIVFIVLFIPKVIFSQTEYQVLSMLGNQNIGFFYALKEIESDIILNVYSYNYELDIDGVDISVGDTLSIKVQKLQEPYPSSLAEFESFERGVTGFFVELDEGKYHYIQFYYVGMIVYKSENIRGKKYKADIR